MTHIAKIQIARRQLGMDDATYYSMLQSVAGVTSSKQLNFRGVAKVIAHLRRCGFVDSPAKHGKRPRPPQSREALIGKIEAQLAAAGRPWAYAEAMAKRICKVEKIDWCDAEQLGKIIAALSYDAKRRAAK